jgi:NAD(P)-dependent dehydrogenase (short-subunit alcohol dehydrogenase family)
MLPAGHEGVAALMGMLDGQVAVVTGGASGIGAALAARFAAEGAAVVVLDRASAPGGYQLDVADEAAVRHTVATIEHEVGPIDLWCSNAGLATQPGLGSDADWEVSWRVHVLAHLYAARHVLPWMRERGRGRFLVTASAAGLLAEADVAAYSVSKHAAVALTEWLAINHGDAGIDFHCLCPQGVRTPLLAGVTADESVTVAAADLLEPEQVADAVLAAFADGRFLILPHPQVAGYEQRRATDRDRWLAGMRRLKSSVHIAAEVGADSNAAAEVGADGNAAAEVGADNEESES